MSIVTLQRKFYSQKNLSGHESGFSLNGTHRNIGFRDYKMSANRRPYKGTEPKGHGGNCGKYDTPTLNCRPNIPQTIVKQSTVSSFSQVRGQHKWIHGGQYPNYWVKPDNNRTLNTGQGLYIDAKHSDNICVIDTNKQSIYENNIVETGPTLCKRTTAGFTFNQMVANAPYTKTIRQPMTSAQYQASIMRNCLSSPNKYADYPGNRPQYC